MKPLYFIACAVLPLGFASNALPQSAAPGGIDRFAQEYLQYANSGNIEDTKHLMDLFCQDPGVVSIQIGEILRGHEAIRAKAVAFLPQVRRIQFVLGKVTASSLGSDMALAVVPLRIVPRQSPVAVEPMREAVMSWVLKRRPEGWCILQEHFSIAPPPPDSISNPRTTQ
jgi:hypothetical protein